jgi:hypothetical protein
MLQRAAPGVASSRKMIMPVVGPFTPDEDPDVSGIKSAFFLLSP